MPTLYELAIYREGRGPAPDDTIIFEGVPEAIRRMSEIRAEHPDATFRLHAPPATPDAEINDLFQRAARSGLTLERTLS